MSPGPLLLNPLPQALHHYERALRGHLNNSSEPLRVSIESSSSRTLRRQLGRVGALARLARVTLEQRPVIVLWPSLGLIDLALCRMSRGPRSVIVHDPVPLRRQVGYGRLGRALGRWGSRGPRVSVIAHTKLAVRALHDLGIECEVVLPHPVMKNDRESVIATAPRPTVLVAGQCKGARDMELLDALPELLPDEWELRVCGRGWPDLTGWTVDSRFLSEAELDEELGRAHAVLLPYQYYFQSGIATRAYELGTPIVARRHEFVEQLYGSEWPGLVDAGDARAWADTLDRIVTQRPQPTTDAEQVADHSWTAFGQQMSAGS